jgi:glycosyltransferase involved in cell wall biosynthesis
LIKLPGLNLFETEERLEAFDISLFRRPTDLFEWFSVTTGGFPEPYTFGERVLDYLRENQNGYDVIHDNQSLCYGLNSLRSRGYPVVSTIHHPITIDRKFDLSHADGFAERLFIRRWYNFLNMQKNVAQSLDEIICVSESSRRRTISDFDVSRKNTNVIHNGIDTELFEPGVQEPDEGPRLMTTASADVPLKGMKYLLEALPPLLKDFPDLTLTVVGELNDNGDTEKLIDRLELNEHVEFHTHIDHSELVDLYSKSTLAVCPSLYEGFGLPAGEAMACEVPLVATRGGALPEVVGSCARLVPPGDSGKLTEAIRTLLNQPEKRESMAKDGRHRVKNHFTWKRAAKQTETIYRRAIANANNRR